MAGTVVHTEKDTHDALKAFCKLRKIQMKVFVDMAIKEAIENFDSKTKAIVPKKAPLRMDDRKNEEAWEKPPFWATREKQSPKLRLVEPVDDTHIRAEAGSMGAPFERISEMRLLGGI
jgi:hypothetical protein